MTSSTPSPSAQELADTLSEFLEDMGDAGLLIISDDDGGLELRLAMLHAATLLRRLSETERERDEIRDLADSVVFHQLCCMGGCHESMKTLAKLAKAIGFEADPATAEEIDAALAASSDVEDDNVAKTHDCYVEEQRDWKARAEAAEAERDALREMLAQADAAHVYEQWTIDGKGAAPMTQEEYFQRFDEARARHRLSQKGSAS